MIKKEKIIELYLSGKSRKDIANETNSCYRYVSHVISEYGRSSGCDKVVYPAVKIWMRKTGTKYDDISRKSGCRYDSVQKSLTGYQPPNKYIIDAIIIMSGMTYEEAFQE